MTTSNSFDFNLNAQQIVEDAHSKLNVIGLGKSLTASQLSKGIRALNVIIKKKPGLIQKIWGTTRVVTALQSPTIWEDSADATKYWEAILPHTTSSDNRPTSGDQYIAYYKSTSSSGIAWASDQSAVSKSVYTVDSSIVDIENVHLILESNRQQTDLERLSRSEFNKAKKDKTIEGTPSKFYFERLNNSSNSYIHIYPSPNDLNGVIIYDAIKYPQDIDSQLNDIDFPQEWYSTLIYELAYNLSFDYPAVSAQKRQELKIEFIESQENASVLDEESGSVFFSPG
jgi:hypothetical protein